MLPHQIPIPDTKLKIEKFGSELLLYSVAGTQAVHLNETAILVYGLCNGERTVGEIIELLETAYPEQSEHIRDEVVDTLTQLSESSVITVADAR